MSHIKCLQSLLFPSFASTQHQARVRRMLSLYQLMEKATLTTSGLCISLVTCVICFFCCCSFAGSVTNTSLPKHTHMYTHTHIRAHIFEHKNKYIQMIRSRKSYSFYPPVRYTHVHLVGERKREQNKTNKSMAGFHWWNAK